MLVQKKAALLAAICMFAGASCYSVQPNSASLFEAAAKGHLHTVKKILRGRTDLEALGTGRFRDNTLLMTAAYSGRAEVVAYLIRQGARVETRTGRGVTALMFAALSVDFPTVETLLEAGADAEAVDSWGMSPLDYAILPGSFAREHDSRSEESRRLGQYRIVERLLAKGARADRVFTEPTTSTDRWTPLIAASMHGRFRIARLLLRKGAKVNSFHAGDDHNSPEAAIHKATRGNHLRVVRLLLKHGSCVDCREQGHDSQTPLTHAIAQANPAMIKLLLAHGARLNLRMQRGTPVTHMLSLGKYDSTVLDLLVEHGGDINAVDCDGATLLMGAIVKGRTELALDLIRHKADFTLRDKHGRNALCHARLTGRHEVQQKLEALGAKPGVCRKY